MASALNRPGVTCVTPLKGECHGCHVTGVPNVTVVTVVTVGSRVIEAMANERAMRDTLNAVDRGSQTAQRMAAAGQVSPDRFNIPSDGEIPSKLANMILNRVVKGSGEKTVASLDKALAAQGATRDALLSAMAKRVQFREQSKAVARGAFNPYGFNAEDDGRANYVDTLLRALGFKTKTAGGAR